MARLLSRTPSVATGGVSEPLFSSDGLLELLGFAVAGSPASDVREPMGCVAKVVLGR